MKGDNKRISMNTNLTGFVFEGTGKRYLEIPGRPGRWVDVEDISRDEQGAYIVSTVTPVWKLYWQGGYEQTWDY